MIDQLAADILLARSHLTGAGCWIWQGAKIPNGYGVVTRWRGKPIGAHRLAWVARHGDVPSNHCVRPCSINKLCCNPDHVRLGPFVTGSTKQPRKPPRRAVATWDEMRARLVDGPGGCLDWPGAKFPSGYGCVSFGGGNQPGSRVAWTLARGEIPAGLLVCHTCDRPPCCNPEHLFLGTKLDNARDMMAKGRHRAMRGSANGAARLTDVDVSNIRRRYAVGNVSTTALGQLFGVSQATIWNVVTRQTYRDVA